jgi:Protein of unknown function (DUF2752)
LKNASPSSRSDRIPLTKRILVPLLVLGLGSILVLVTSLPALCPLRIALGVPCPSCGLTRATRLALGGDLAGATAMHPLWFLIVPYVGAIATAQLVSYARRGDFLPLERNPIVKHVGQVLLALLIVVWVARFLGAFGGPCPV